MAASGEPSRDFQCHGFHCSRFTSRAGDILEMGLAPVACCERMTGYAEVMPVNPTAPLLPTCRRYRIVAQIEMPSVVTADNPLCGRGDLRAGILKVSNAH
jgi:hypothetical protein